MKKILLTLILAAVSIQFGNAQCSVMIVPDPGHIQITSSQTLDAIGTVYWVCEGVVLDVNSSQGATFLLEQGVTLNVNGSNGDAIYAKQNCVINNNAAEDLAVIADPSNVTLNNNSTGSLTITTVCTPVIYDYSLVGGAACIGQGVSVVENSLQSLTLFPNPVIQGHNINLDGEYENLESIAIFDLSGKRVYFSSIISNKISAQKLDIGVYMIQLYDGENTEMKKIEIY